MSQFEFLGFFSSHNLSFRVLSQFFSSPQHLDNRPTLRAAVRDSRDVLWRGCVILLLRGCMIFFWRGCTIFSLTKVWDFFCREVACVLWRSHDFFVERLGEFLCGEVA